MKTPEKSLRSAAIPHARVQSINDDPSMAKQSMADETNINAIMKKYDRTGLVTHINKHGGTYGEMPSHEDFHAAMNVVASSTQMFDELPATIRARFLNDPSNFLHFVGDEENRDEMVEMGLIAPEADTDGPEVIEDPLDIPEEEPTE